MPRYLDPRFDMDDQASSVSDHSNIDRDFLDELAQHPPSSNPNWLKEPEFHGTPADFKDYLEWKRQLDSIRRSVKRADQKSKARDDYDREMARQEAERDASREAKEMAAAQEAGEKAMKEWLYERWKAQEQATANRAKERDASSHGQAGAEPDPEYVEAAARRADEMSAAKWIQDRASSRRSSKSTAPRSDTNSSASGKRVAWAKPEASFMQPSHKRPRETHPYDYESESASGSITSSSDDQIPVYRRPRPNGVGVLNRDPDYASKNDRKFSYDGMPEPIFVKRGNSKKYATSGDEPNVILKPSSSKSECRQQSDWQNTRKYEPKDQPQAQAEALRTEAHQPISDWNQRNWQNQATHSSPSHTRVQSPSQNQDAWKQTGWQNAAPSMPFQDSNNDGWSGVGWQNSNWADSQSRNKIDDDEDRRGWQNMDGPDTQYRKHNDTSWNQGQWQNPDNNRNQGHRQESPRPNNDSWNQNDNNWNQGHRQDMNRANEDSRNQTDNNWNQGHWQNSEQPDDRSWNNNDDNRWDRGHWQTQVQPSNEPWRQSNHDRNRGDWQNSGWPDSQPERQNGNMFHGGWQNTANRPGSPSRPRSRNREYEMSGALGNWGGEAEPNTARRAHHRPPSVENFEDDKMVDPWANQEW